MRTTFAIAALVIAVLGPVPAPASAGGATGLDLVAASAWIDTRSKGGPIRECYLESCDAGPGTFEGERVEWSHFATNPRGNRWYFVRDSIGNTGWMYCGNLTAGC